MLEEMIEFSKLVGKLKKLPRSGWKSKVGIKYPESVADHVFRSAIFAMVFGDIRSLNTEKMMRMALLHELQEVVTGDLTPGEKEQIPKNQLRQVEYAAIQQVLSHLPPNLSKIYMDLWEEFEDEKSEESKLVKELEKLELAFQTLEYEKEGYEKEKLDEFYNFVRERLKDPEVKKIFELLKKERT